MFSWYLIFFFFECGLDVPGGWSKGPHTCLKGAPLCVLGAWFTFSSGGTRWWLSHLGPQMVGWVWWPLLQPCTSHQSRKHTKTKFKKFHNKTQKLVKQCLSTKTFCVCFEFLDFYFYFVFVVSLFECEFDLLIGPSSRPYVTCMSYLLVRILAS